LKLIDSCGWLEFILKGPRAETYRDYLLGEHILVPTVVMYEVYKVIARDLSQELAAQTAVQMKTKQVIPLTDNIALLAAELCLKHKLGMGDAIVYATAQAHEATLVTSDYHFADMPGVEYLGAEKG
jgi:predicted nucleic acid-binding protein